MAKTRSMYQDADTGKIVSKDYADKHPKETIKHTIKPCKPKGK